MRYENLINEVTLEDNQDFHEEYGYLGKQILINIQCCFGYYFLYFHQGC